MIPAPDSEVEVADTDVSDRSSDDAAEPQLDIPDAHLGEQSTKIIIPVSCIMRPVVCLMIVFNLFL